MLWSVTVGATKASAGTARETFSLALRFTMKHFPWHFVSSGAPRAMAEIGRGDEAIRKLRRAEARPVVFALFEPRSGEFANTARWSEERLACAEPLAPSFRPSCTGRAG